MAASHHDATLNNAASSYTTSMDSTRLAVGNWIEDRYSRRRRHASIGQISPVDFELQYSRQIADTQEAA